MSRKILKVYLSAAGMLLLIGLTYGLLLPSLISAASTEAVLLGIVLLILVPVVLYVLFSLLFKKKESRNA